MRMRGPPGACAGVSRCGFWCSRQQHQRLQAERWAGQRKVGSGDRPAMGGLAQGAGYPESGILSKSLASGGPARSALAEEGVLGPLLAKVAPPRREVRVRVRLDVPARQGAFVSLSVPRRHACQVKGPLVDVRRGREVGRVAPDVDRALRLVHADVVHAQVHRERHAPEVDLPKVVRHAEVHDDVLTIRVTVSIKAVADSKREGKVKAPGPTMGSCETGRDEISTIGSATMPATLSVHEILLFEIHVIYYHRIISSVSPSPPQESKTHRVVEPGLVLEPIDRVAPGLVLVAVRVRVRHDARRLLLDAARVRVLHRDRRVRDLLVRARVQPDVRVVERLCAPTHTRVHSPSAAGHSPRERRRDTHRPLRGLRDLRGQRRARDLRLEHVDLGRRASNERPVAVLWARVALARARAARELLPGQVREHAVVPRVAVLRRGDGLPVQRLIRRGPDVARVVRVRPLGGMRGVGGDGARRRALSQGDQGEGRNTRTMPSSVAP